MLCATYDLAPPFRRPDGRRRKGISIKNNNEGEQSLHGCLRSSAGATQHAPFRPRFWRPQKPTRGHCTMAFCCTVQRSSVLVVKRPEVPCCGQPSFLSFQNLPPAVRLKHPFPINNRHGRSRSFWFCRRKAVFALSKAELRHC